MSTSEGKVAFGAVAAGGAMTVGALACLASGNLPLAILVGLFAAALLKAGWCRL